MGGPVLVIELSEAPSHAAIQRVRELLVRSSVRCEETRLGEYDVHIDAERLGVADTWGEDGRRPVLVSLMGPGFGDGAVFEAEHANEVDQEPLIAAVMDLIGGVANVELREDQDPSWPAFRLLK